MDQYEPPLKIFIPLPSKMKRALPHSAGTYGSNMRVRCTDAEYDLVEREAEAIGLTTSSFARWCITRTAIALRNHRDKSSTSIEAEGVYEPQERGD